MKKLLFVLAFAFIGQQALAQMYIVTYSAVDWSHTDANCNTGMYTRLLTTVDPTGSVTYICMQENSISISSSNLITLNQEFNAIISQGYKLIETNSPSGATLTSNTKLSVGTVWYFAIPWTSSGLEEVPTTLNNFTITPNPANEFVDISLDYSLKGESQIIFISEAGYIYHKETINEVSKNEKYNIDISKIPAGKYLVTIVNSKTYTTPQKIIIL